MHFFKLVSERISALPDERFVTWSWLRVFGVWISAALFVLALNAVLFFLPTANRGYALVAHKWRLAQNLPPESTVVFLGDSSGGSGLDPLAFQEATGFSATNLCTIGNMGTLGDVWFLQNLVAHGTKPKMVLVMHTLDAWGRSPAIDVLAQIPESPGFWNRLCPPLRPGFSDTIAMLSARYVPIYSQIVSFRQGFVEAAKSGHLLPDSGLAVITKEGFDPITQSNPEFVQMEIEGEHLPALRSNSLGIQPSNEIEMQALMQVCATENIRLVFCHGPVAQDLATTPEFQRHYASWLARMRSLTVGYPSVTVVPDLFAFPSDQMQNADHVTAPTAKEFTRKISLSLQKMGVLPGKQASPAGGVR